MSDDTEVPWQQPTCLRALDLRPPASAVVCWTDPAPPWSPSRGEQREASVPITAEQAEALLPLVGHEVRVIFERDKPTRIEAVER